MITLCLFGLISLSTKIVKVAGSNPVPAAAASRMRPAALSIAVSGSHLIRDAMLAAVSGVADEVKGELAKAYVILKPDAEVSRGALVTHCRQHLAAYKVPRAMQFVTSVPVTSSGKIMRRMLSEVDDSTFDIG